MNGPQKLNLGYTWQLLTYMHQMQFIIVFVIQILKLVRRNHNYIQMRHPLKKENMADIDTKKHKAFLKVIEYLQNNDDENFTVADLVSMMSGEEEPYDNKTMKNKLTQEFGDEIVISSLEGIQLKTFF